MNQKEENTPSMFKNVQTAFTHHESIFTVAPALLEMTGKFNGIIHGIDLFATKKESGEKKGKTQAKNVTRKQVIDATVKIGSAMVSFANNTHNTELLIQVHVSETGLSRLSDEELKRKTLAINGLAIANKEGLKKFAITDAKLTAYGEMIALFDTKVDAKRTGTTEQVLTTQSLDQLIAAGNKLLREEIDTLVESLIDDDPVFYNAYHQARIIIDRPATHSGAEPPPTEPPHDGM